MANAMARRGGHLPTLAKGAIKMLRRAAGNQGAAKFYRPTRNFLPLCYAVQHKFGAHRQNRIKLTPANVLFRHVR
ncbi:hypothetical protein [Cupriavidus oxalaticus]|uniref:hypothetical protein n=1 Tax=Cupriavidus oxalaticus TaxID=96344 RepID=UPI003176F66A